jgi:hypothetical protein
VKNKRGEHVKRVRQKQNMFMKHVTKVFAKNIMPWAFGIGVFGLVVWRSRLAAQYGGILVRIGKIWMETVW